MSTYPNATQRPVDSHGAGMTQNLGLLLHVTTNSASPFGFFSNTSNQASSTWWVAADGSMEQYVQSGTKAWAQAAGNAIYDSVETSGVPSDPLTAAQCESLANLYVWGHKTNNWPFVLAEKPGDPGFGWHGMGGASYGNHPGCPGDARKAQRQGILDRAQQILNGGATPAPSAPVVRNPYAGSAAACQKGSSGDAVRFVQWAVGCGVDGGFGPQTDTAVRAFQKSHGLTVDGRVGPQTIGALRQVTK